MRIIFTLFIILLISDSCSSGKKALEKGDYYNAVIQSVNRLRSNPDLGKALSALKEGYPMSLTFFQDRIDNVLNSNALFKYTEVVGCYEKMNHLANEISRCPVALKLFPQVNFYTGELANARKLAAEEQYNAGIVNERINTRLSSKEAYYNFSQADRFSPGYKDVKQRMEDARYKATLKVVVEQIPVSRKYQLSSDFFLGQIIEHLVRNRPNEFVAFYSPESAQKADLKYPDQLLRMNFDEFVVGQVYEKETIREVTRDSVEVGTVTLKDGQKIKAYNTVKASLITRSRELISKGVLDVTVTDPVQNTVLTQRKFPGQFVWSSEWSSFTGDERALSKDQLGSCNRKPKTPPGSQDLFIEFTKPIFNQVTPFLKSFYQRY